MTTHTVEFIPAYWLELAAWCPGLVLYGFPVLVERRVRTRRAADVALLLQSLQSA